ncbi:MAG: acyltransferase family protein, partial [Pseudonocardiaceae bacterium]|nr:acyltransferase family protein [Pseudonocardiaceae bacterium]
MPMDAASGLRFRIDTDMAPRPSGRGSVTLAGHTGGNRRAVAAGRTRGSARPEPATTPSHAPASGQAAGGNGSGPAPEDAAGKTAGEVAGEAVGEAVGEAAAKRRIAFVDIGRAIGALLVVYTHFDQLFLRQNKGENLWLTDAINNVFVSPMKLTDQGVGAVAIPFFFLASGFVVTPIALRLGSGRFAVNRLFRVYPLLIFVVLISAVLFALGSRPLTTGEVTEVNVGVLLSNVSLANFVLKPLVAFVGVAWTLAIEVLFYLLIVALLPVLRRNVWLAIAIELELVVLVLATHGQFGASYRAFAVNVAYLVMPILGQVLWAVWERKIPVWLAGGYLGVGWGLFVWAGALRIDPDYLPRPFPFAVAAVLFLLGLFAEERLRERRSWTVLSERTYSIYLLHGAVGFPAMFAVYDLVPVWLTVLIGLAATAAAVEVAYRLVERPSHNLGRRLSRRGVRRSDGAGLSDVAGQSGGAGRSEKAREPEPDSDVERTDVLAPVAASTSRQPARRNGDRAAPSREQRGGQPRPGRRGNGRPPDVQPRDGQPRDGQPRHGRRDGQPRDDWSRDGQASEGQRRDGQRRDGQRRDGQRRDGQRRDGRSRNGQPRDGQPREGRSPAGRPPDGQREAPDGPPRRA